MVTPLAFIAAIPVGATTIILFFDFFFRRTGQPDLLDAEQDLSVRLCDSDRRRLLLLKCIYESAQMHTICHKALTAAQSEHTRKRKAQSDLSFFFRRQHKMPDKILISAYGQLLLTAIRVLHRNLYV